MKPRVYLVRTPSPQCAGRRHMTALLHQLRYISDPLPPCSADPAFRKPVDIEQSDFFGLRMNQVSRCSEIAVVAGSCAKNAEFALGCHRANFNRRMNEARNT